MQHKNILTAMGLAVLLIGCSSPQEQSYDTLSGMQKEASLKSLNGSEDTGSNKGLPAEQRLGISKAQSGDQSPIKKALSDQDYAKIAYPITQAEFPKTFAKWGKNWIDDINAMMPKVVAKIDGNPGCDKPIAVDLSDSRSDTQKEAVFYVDCQNNERFYVNQNDLKSKKLIKAESQILQGDPSDYIARCESMLKSKLGNPKVFEVFAGAKASKVSSGNIAVEIIFKSTDELDRSWNRAAVCIFQTNGEAEVSLTNKISA